MPRGGAVSSCGARTAGSAGRRRAVNALVSLSSWKTGREGVALSALPRRNYRARSNSACVASSLTINLSSSRSPRTNRVRERNGRAREFLDLVPVHGQCRCDVAVNVFVPRRPICACSIVFSAAARSACVGTLLLAVSLQAQPSERRIPRRCHQARPRSLSSRGRPHQDWDLPCAWRRPGADCGLARGRS